MTNSNDMIFPRSMELAFSYNDTTLQVIPLFLLLVLIRQQDMQEASTDEYRSLEFLADPLSKDYTDSDTNYHLT